MQLTFTQVTDAVHSVERIGLPATIIVLLMVGGGILLWALAKYFIGRAEKKDDQLEEKNKLIVDLISARQADLIRLEQVALKSAEALERTAQAVEHSTDNMRATMRSVFEEFAAEIKRRR